MLIYRYMDFSGGSDGKESACSAGDPSLIPGLRRSPGEVNGNPLQYSCLENLIDSKAWWATAHGRDRHDWVTFTFHFSSYSVTAHESVRAHFLVSLTDCPANHFLWSSLCTLELSCELLDYIICSFCDPPASFCKYLSHRWPLLLQISSILHVTSFFVMFACYVVATLADSLPSEPPEKLNR